MTVSALRKDFGANNFYGGNAPSREWTNQTLVAFDHRHRCTGGWSLAIDASYRTHGDRFLFDQVNPARSDNRHRTHAVIGRLRCDARIVAPRLPSAIEGGGDWIRSTNLGDHEQARVSGFAQWRRALGPRLRSQMRSSRRCLPEFGDAWSPSVAFGWWASHAVTPPRVAGTGLSCAHVHRALLLRSREPGPRGCPAGARLVGGGWRRCRAARGVLVQAHAVPPCRSRRDRLAAGDASRTVADLQHPRHRHRGRRDRRASAGSARRLPARRATPGSISTRQT